MPYAVYKIIHVVGIVMLFAALGGLGVHALNGGDKSSNKARALVGATHGIALFLLLVAGFGMLARLGITWPWPAWVWVKFALWLVLGAIIVIPYRKPQLSKLYWWLLPVLGGLAAWVAVYKLAGLAV